MKPMSYIGYTLLAAVLAMTFIVPGCKPKKRHSFPDVEGESTAKAAKTPIVPGTASIKGKIVYGPARPAYQPTAQILNNPECRTCKPAGFKDYWDGDQKWIVGMEKGIANVVVRLKGPANSFFETSDADKKKAAKEEVILDQTCCNFDPHVLVLFPAYTTDGKNSEPTGQKLLIKNSGTMVHNTKLSGDERKGNIFNLTIPPLNKATEKVTLGVENDTPIPISCQVHPWMSATVYAYNHPYALSTKEDGVFEMHNINVGTALTVEVVHEGELALSIPIVLAGKEQKDLGTITLPVQK